MSRNLMQLELKLPAILGELAAKAKHAVVTLFRGTSQAREQPVRLCRRLPAVLRNNLRERPMIQLQNMRSGAPVPAIARWSSPLAGASLIAGSSCETILSSAASTPCALG
jgi:hypothetical protein